jgi:hypothetical protein
MIDSVGQQTEDFRKTEEQGGIMGINSRFSLSIVTAVLIVLSVIGCAKEQKQAKLEISDQEFILRQDTDHSFVIDAKGSVKNVGEVDVKNVVVTGYCRSCGEVLVNGKWFISDYEKTPDQKDVISYLAAGDKEAFKFKGVAFFMDQSGSEPQKMPEEMELVIESYETVE